MRAFVRCIRVLGLLAVLAGLAGSCGPGVMEPEPDPSYGDETVCILVNGHLLCR